VIHKKRMLLSALIPPARFLTIHEKRPAVHPHLIFLSAKREDYVSANRVYSHLTEHGYSVFFSDQTLPRMGNSDYRREIDRALEQAKHLIVVTSRKEYVESKWVEAEWGSFINEKRSGRKDGILSCCSRALCRLAIYP